MLQRILKTQNETAPLILRVLLGLVMFPHGAQKLLGWFGGYGFTGTMGFFTDAMGIPAAFAFLAIVAEFFGSLALISGFLTRIGAFGIASVMTVAALTVHVKNGFFMNWIGNQGGEGFEFHLIAIAISVAIMIKGAGAWSVDAYLTNRKNKLALN